MGANAGWIGAKKSKSYYDKTIANAMQKVIRRRCLAVLVRIDMEHGLRADTSNAPNQKRAETCAKIISLAPVFCIWLLDDSKNAAKSLIKRPTLPRLRQQPAKLLLLHWIIAILSP